MIIGAPFSLDFQAYPHRSGATATAATERTDGLSRRLQKLAAQLQEDGKQKLLHV